MKECSENLEVGLSELKETVCFFVYHFQTEYRALMLRSLQTQIFCQTSSEYTESANDLLLQTRAQLRHHLIDGMRANKPTGSTPRKRPRPEVFVHREVEEAEGIDVFDEPDRRQLLEKLRERKVYTESTTQEDEESRDAIYDAKSALPRASSTLAARQAARRSSVMRA
jgi:hypothetical protein